MSSSFKKRLRLISWHLSVILSKLYGWLISTAERASSPPTFRLVSVVESELGMLSFVITGSGWRHDILSLVAVGLGVVKLLVGVALAVLQSFSCK